MRLDSAQGLERLALSEEVDSSWLCRAARALDELDLSLVRLEREVDGPAGEFAQAKERNPRLARAAARARADGQKLHDQARSLRRRLVLGDQGHRPGAGAQGGVDEPVVPHKRVLSPRSTTHVGVVRASGARRNDRVDSEWARSRCVS